MGCGSSSPAEPKEAGERHEPENSQNKKKSSDAKSPPSSLPQTPKITVEFVGDPEENCEDNNLAAANDNFNNGNEEDGKSVPCEKVTEESTVSANELTDDASKEEPLVSKEATQYDAKPKEKEGGSEEEEILQAQRSFDTAIRFACLAVKPETVLNHASKHVRSLRLPRSLPPGISLMELLKRLPFLQVIDVSDNLMGPQCFRALMLAMAHNATITSLNAANNHTDTDSAISVGKMLSKNSSLISLNVSGNYLGKDFFSRCVGPALASNNTLQILNCEGIGSVDFTCLLENACEANILNHLNLSHNTLTKSGPCVEQLIRWIQKSDCSLRSIDLKSFGFKDNDLIQLSTALKTNQSLSTVEVSSNEIATAEGLFEFCSNCLQCQSLENLALENVTPKQKGSITPDGKLEDASNIRSLKLSGCDISDSFITSLVTVLPAHGLSSLEELNLSNNGELTTQCLKAILEVTTGSEGESKLQKLHFAMNQAEGIADVLTSMKLPDLVYLNLRKAKITHTGVGQLEALTSGGQLETVILDGIKLAGSDALKTLLGSAECSVIALSLANCQLTDSELDHLAESVKGGLQLCMLKLSGNRFQDKGIQNLVDALRSHATHPLKLIDIQSNQLTSAGATALSELFNSSSHKSEVHSINVSNNNISSDGLKSLVAVLGEGKLTTIVANRQKASYGEEEMDVIFQQLAKTLGFNPQSEAQSCDLPKITPGITVKLSGLGGFPGDLGRLLDSIAIVTDDQIGNHKHMTFSDILEMSSAIKGQDTVNCLLKKEEWDNIIGAEKEAPTWLQLSDHRERALYMVHLPAAVSPNKLEGLLDIEADCSVDEVVLMKDELTRKNNGLAWALLSDKKFVQTAVNFYNAGEAKVFSQSFVLSRVNVTVDDDGSHQAEKAARDEMTRRAAERSSDEAAHRKLIQQSYQESQARHAYRLANPAYADGRIW